MSEIGKPDGIPAAAGNAVCLIYFDIRERQMRRVLVVSIFRRDECAEMR